MNLSPYVETVRAGVAQASAMADDHTQDIVRRLGQALDSATRLALISALSDAASSISADLAPASVEVRMAGLDPEFVVSVPPSATEPELLAPASNPQPDEEDEELPEEPLARVSLRLPASVKSKVDELAAADGISTNAWLIRAVSDAIAVARRGDWPPPPPPPPFGSGVFGPHGPFGPHGVFGPRGIFGGGGGGGSATEGPDRDEHPRDREARRGKERDRGRPGTGGVQGWVR